MRRIIVLSAVAVAFALVAWWWLRPAEPPAWSAGEVELLRSLSLASLPALPPVPSNAVADDPRAADFGQRLFFDTRLSGNNEVSCATCHQPERNFTDGRQKGQGIGQSARNTRSIVGAAYSPWLYWDGRKDSLWSQALSPLEDVNEHGGTRLQIARLVTEDPAYRAVYEALFGALPDFTDRARFPLAAAPQGSPAHVSAWNTMRAGDQLEINRVFANIGKAIEAFERQLLPGSTRFDDYVSAVVGEDLSRQGDAFSKKEVRGLRLFIGKARCLECHNGPLLTNNEFHNTGLLPFPGELPDRGRISGIREVEADPFNCQGEFSDDPQRACPELRFARTGPELLGGFRTPSLRDLSLTAPFMHEGQLATLKEVIRHYNLAAPALVGHNQAKPLKLSRREIEDLEAFLLTLDATSAGKIAN